MSSNFLNIHTTGFGYLGRARWVQVEGQSPYLSVVVAMKHGNKDNLKTVYFDCIVAGSALTESLGGLVEQINAGSVCGRFVLEGMNPLAHREKRSRGYALGAKLVAVQDLKISSQNPSRRRSLARRPFEGLLSGAVAGLAHWLGINVVATRIVLLASLLISPFASIVLYVALVVWIENQEGSPKPLT